MTIRRRLAFSFAAILLLFGLNLAISFWGRQKRSAAVEDLNSAVSRRLLAASVNEHLANIQTERALLGTQSLSSGAVVKAFTSLDRELQESEQQIGELKILTSPEDRAGLDPLEKDFRQLVASRRSVEMASGAKPSQSLGDFTTQADLILRRLRTQVLPQLQADEERRMAAATAAFDRAGQVVQVIPIVLLLVSSMVAAFGAFRISNYMDRGFLQLKLAAEKFGQKELDHRIDMQVSDEIGEVANAYDEMAGKLQSAREQFLASRQEIERRNVELDDQRKVSDDLLVNILPIQVAKELKEKGSVDPKYFEDVTIIFTDFVGFTRSTEQLAAEDLVHLLHDYFTSFDEIVQRYYMEKLKTIGDSYMYVGGLPLGRRARRVASHPVDSVLAAMEMVKAVQDRDRPDGPVHWAVRIGIHTGPVIAGVVGFQKFAFDVWGETVNFASRMELSAAPNRINISHNTYLRVKDFIDCEHRGKVLTKEKREEDMYFVKGVLPSLLDDTGQNPPDAFLRRYRVYFQKELPAFPAFAIKPPDIVAG